MRNRKNWNRLIVLVLSAAMLVPAQAVYAAEGNEAEVGITAYAKSREADANGFKIEGGELVEYTGTAIDVVIPKGVTSIGDYAFYERSDLTSITIPGNVTNIGWFAFGYCSGLTSITIPDSVKSIGGYAFYNCSNLTGIRVAEGNKWYDSRGNCNAIIETESGTLIAGCRNTIIPESVTSIGASAFSGCRSLTGIKIPGDVTDIGDSAFENCSGLTGIEIPKKVTGIGKEAFFGCSGLTSLEIPGNVTSIGDSAFENCSGLTGMEIPGNVTSIGECIFNGCSKLTNIKVDEANQRYDSRGNCDAIIETESNTLVAGCMNTIVPGNVTSIGDYAFRNCSGLTRIGIPKSVAYVGYNSFRGCGNLASITVEEGNQKYDSRGNCNAIIQTDKKTLVVGCKSTIIPGSVTSIGSEAFGDCSGLTRIKIPKNVASIGYEAFGGCSGLTSIAVEEGNRKYDSRKNCNAIIETERNTLIVGCKNTIIPKDVTRIDALAFQGCSDLKKITIPGSVTKIGGNVFSGCSKELTIYGKTGSCAERYAKEYDIKFHSTGKIISGNDVTISRKSYAYDGKAKKPTVTVKDGNKVLKAGTDYIVKYYNNVNAGTAKVTVRGTGNNEGTVTKKFTITVKKNTSHTIDGCQYKVTGKSTVSLSGIKDSKTKKVKIPKTITIGGTKFKVTAIANKAFKKNTKITSVEIGDNVKTVGASAFEGCTKLTKVTIGKDVTEIGGSAFKSCKKLETVTVKSSGLKKVGKNALKGIKTTARVIAPAKKLSAYNNLFKNKGQGKKVKIVK